ncbi:MAG: excinuclease ABC subunit C [Cyclobacteriaceae bacterium]|nr:excinuclease ABC subunit C [Cyclobacteriaceae bacterium]
MQQLTFSKDEVNRLPAKPGIYKFYSSREKLIYVGKAKDLKKRVASYFQRNLTAGRKTQKMVNETTRIEVAIVNSEFDAFLLENSLIKENQPKYNILLKDDKTFPFICVTNEPFPRVISTRHRELNAGRYFGPYASVRAMKNVLELFRNLYHVRTCTLALNEPNIRKGKFKVCLEYHIGKCKGPCEGFQSEEDYNREIEQVTHILKGNLKPVKDHFENEMKDHAFKLEFEKAEEAKQRLILVDKFQSKSVVVNPNITNIDVFTIVSDDKYGYINYLKIHNGSINQTLNVEVKKKMQESDEEILSLWIIEIRKNFKSNAGEILTNINLDTQLGGEVVTPQRGDKRKLVELSLKNALYHKKEKSTVRTPRKSNEDRILMKLQEDLQLRSLPVRIECFDNSNIQGSNPVAAMVCFIHGKPAKNEYRKFNIKTVQGPDDFASMHEIVRRRYYRSSEENRPMPDLIVIDGGKGQLNAAINALRELDLYGSIAIVGIAKRLEEIYYPEDEIPIHIDKKSPSLKLLQQIRNEAHRFAITFHRKKRSDQSLQSELDEISGIGEQTKNKLLIQYKSLPGIRNAPTLELIKLIGRSKTGILVEFLKKKEAGA